MLLYLDGTSRPLTPEKGTAQIHCAVLCPKNISTGKMRKQRLAAFTTSDGVTVHVGRSHHFTPLPYSTFFRP